MDKLTLQIKNNILSYPLIFPSREHVLFQMYIVTGNGYHWEDGELISDSEDRVTTEKEALNKIREKHYSYKNEWLDLEDFPEKYQEKLKGDVVEKTRKLRNRVLKAEEIAKGDYGDTNEKISWVAESKKYSKVFQVPDNIKLPYLEGAIEIIQVRINRPDLFELKDDFENIEESEYEDLLTKLKTKKEELI